jgi:hypothetical protein
MKLIYVFLIAVIFISCEREPVQSPLPPTGNYILYVNEYDKVYRDGEKGDEYDVIKFFGGKQEYIVFEDSEGLKMSTRSGDEPLGDILCFVGHENDSLLFKNCEDNTQGWQFIKCHYSKKTKTLNGRFKISAREKVIGIQYRLVDYIGTLKIVKEGK